LPTDKENQFTEICQLSFNEDGY